MLYLINILWPLHIAYSVWYKKFVQGSTTAHSKNISDQRQHARNIKKYKTKTIFSIVDNLSNMCKYIECKVYIKYICHTACKETRQMISI